MPASGRAPGDTRINYTVEISPHGGILPPQLTARLHTGVRPRQQHVGLCNRDSSSMCSPL